MVVLNSLKDPKLIELIKAKAIGVLPTDTVYGLVCLAADAQAVKQIYSLKSRKSKPGTVIAASIDQLTVLGIKRRYLKAVEQFWPNPISIIIPVGSELDYLLEGQTGLAIRVVGNSEVRDLLIKTGPLLTTSANQPGNPPAATIKQAQNYFKDTIDYYVDGGDLSNREPSTIIKMVDDAIELIRKGAVDINENGELSNR